MSSRTCVALCVFNGGAHLRQALESVLRQEDEEVVVRVYDNGSTDGSLELARGYARADPRVVVTRNETNLGYYGSLDRALGEAEEDFFVPWAADDVMEPRNLAEKIGLLERTGAGFAFGPHHVIDADGRVTGSGTDVAGLPEVVRPPDLLFFLVPMNGIWMPGTVVVRTEAARAAGGFEPRLTYCGDWDLWLRLSLRFDAAICGAPLVRWRRHDASGTATRGRNLMYAWQHEEVVERAFADPCLPEELAPLREQVLAATLAHTATWLAEDGCLRSRRGEAAYARAFAALELQPRQPEFRRLFGAVVRAAELDECPLPLDAALQLPADALVRARIYEGVRRLHARGLLARLALAVHPDELAPVVPELERELGSLPADVDVVPCEGIASLLNARELVALGRDEATVEAAESRGRVALPVPSPVPVRSLSR